eukprot:6568844-Prymnesium_polylepis.1
MSALAAPADWKHVLPGVSSRLEACPSWRLQQIGSMPFPGVSSRLEACPPWRLQQTGSMPALASPADWKHVLPGVSSRLEACPHWRDSSPCLSDATRSGGGTRAVLPIPGPIPGAQCPNIRARYTCPIPAR